MNWRKIFENFITVGICVCYLSSGFVLGQTYTEHTMRQTAVVVPLPTAIRQAQADIVLVSESISDKVTHAAVNKNPLNVKTNRTDPMVPWDGQIGVDEHGHVMFKSWEYGIRAAAFVLRSYAKRHEIDTISGIVDRFAAGNRDSYKAFLAHRLGLGIDESFDIIARMPELLRAMSRFECGQTLPDELFIPYDILAKI